MNSYKISDIAVLMILLIIANFLPLGISPLFDLDEGAFSEATREMLVSKNYITTYLNGDLRFDKPILIYWLQLFSVKIFGINTFSFRLPSAIAGSLWVIFTYLFTKRYFDKQKAFFSAIIMTSALQITIISKAAIADALLNLFIALSMFCFYKYYKSKKKIFLYNTFLFISLGFLTKGPVAILIPLATSLIFLIIKKDFLFWLKSIFDPVGILIFAIIGLPWYIDEYIKEGDNFINGFFLKHNLHRFNSPLEHHHGGFYYYFIVLIIGLMPFSYLFFKLTKQIKNIIKDDLKLYLLIWFGFVFVFFSFSGTKLPHYVIYGYTPLFILISTIIDKTVSKKTLFVSTIFFTLLMLIFPTLAYIFKDSIRDKFAVVLIKNIYNGFDLFYHVSVLLLLISLIYLFFKNISIKKSIIAISCVFTILINYAVIPAYGKLMQYPVKKAALIAKKEGLKVLTNTKLFPSFNLYYQGLTPLKNPQKGDIVFSRVTELKKYNDYKTIYKENGFALIKVTK